jgi:4-hydroxy-tetrahydrodipicolinate synthase
MPALPDGVLAASLTPLTDDLRPDRPALAAHVKHLLSDGCDAVLLFGTTGEGLSFTVGERTAALEAVLEAGVPAHKLLVGTGATSLPDTTTLTRHATERAVGGVLVLPPFHFTDVSDDGLIATYRRLVEAINTPALSLYFYHYPALTQVPISFPVIETLRAQYPEVVAGIKDSTDEWDHKEALCRSFPDLQVFTGTERHLGPLLEAGGAGTISATVNVTTPLARAVVEAVRADGDPAPAQSLLSEYRTRLSALPTIPGLKQIVAWRRDAPGWRRVRPPQAPLADEQTDVLHPLYDELEATLPDWRPA